MMPYSRGMLVITDVDAQKQGCVRTIGICTNRYPTAEKYSLELMFANFVTAKIAKDLNPLKIFPNRC